MDKKINNCGCGGIAEFETAKYWLWISCNHCGNRTDRYSVNSNDEQLSMIVDEWNKAHPIYELSYISNAQQSVKWLEEGKGIYNESFNNLRYFKMINGTICSFNIYDNKMLSDDVKFLLFELLDRNWELYEAPKYKETSFIDAFTQYLKDIKITAYFKDEDEEYTLQENDENGIGLSNARLDESKCLTTEIIQKAVWRIYEN